MKTAMAILTSIYLTCGCLVSGSYAQDVERGWTLVREDLDLFINPAEGTLRLEGSLVARLDHDETSSGLMLALNSRSLLLRFEEVRAGEAEVELNFDHPELPNSLLSQVSFATPKYRGDKVQINFVCQSEAQGRQFVVAESIALASWVEAWYPILPPQDGVSLGGATKVPGITTFHLPQEWHAVTNGGLVSAEQTASGTVEVWETKQALSRSFAAGPYRVMREKANGLDVSLFLLSDDLPDPRDHVESLTLAMEAMVERWGPYPYPSYAIAEVPMDKGAFGASSEQGFIMVKTSFLQTPGGNLPLFAHEAAHGWWGNTVGTDGPGSLLCSESLAQYGAVIAAERVWGNKAATEFLRFSRPGYVPSQCARGFFKLWRLGHDKPMAELVSGGDFDHALADAKGHWVYHMLRRRVGDDTFFATLRHLIDEFTGRTMTLDDLRAAFIAAAPDARLEQFFAQWLDATGAPVLRHEWHISGDKVVLTITQMQDGDPFDLDLDVLLDQDDGSSHMEHLHLFEHAQSFNFDNALNVTGIHIDPDHRLLLWEPEFGEAPAPGLEGVTQRALTEKQLRLYAGEFVVSQVGLQLRFTDDSGHLMLTLGDKSQRLVHTGEHRFRSDNGFIIFKVKDGQADALVFVRDEGGSRTAVRQK
ncbi:MAG: M1 family aminopeptidase [Phycisphaerales bacterium]